LTKVEFADPKFVEIYRARNLPEAHSIRIALEESGIRVQIEGELLQGAVGDLPLGWVTAPRILVEESQIAAARRVIEQARSKTVEANEGENDEAIRCLACGKSIAEGETRCRSCGWSYQGGEGSSEKETIPSATKTGQAPEAQTKESASSIPCSPQFTRRELWFEVLAVITIGIFPHIRSVFVLAWLSPIKWPFWLYEVNSFFQSACISFAVLYLIYRSGEPWATFGIKRPHPRDIGLGILVYLANVFLVWFLSAFPIPEIVEPGKLALPGKGTDYLLMVASFSASAFAEELVTRAYLITRFEQLLQSRPKAVILSAAWFGSYHLYYGVGGFIDVMMLGIVLGTMYLLIRRIWPFALGHMLWNVIATLKVPA
jgi:membrane protease YdiL (CAAX protease family)